MADFDGRVAKIRCVAKSVESAYANLVRDVQDSRPTACVTGVVAVLVLWALVLSGPLVGFILLASFTLGLTATHSVFLKLGECGDYFEDDASDDAPVRSHGFCAVCDKAGCQRHDSDSFVESVHPWKNLQVPVALDKAIEEFLELTLSEFVYAWYSERSGDECFVHQVRLYLRRAVSIIIRRLKKVDVAKFVVEKAGPAAVAHVDAFVRAQRDAARHKDVAAEQATFALLGADGQIHAALRSRGHEARYLRAVARCVVAAVVPPRERGTGIVPSVVRELLANAVLVPAMDAVADPDVVNYLVLLAFSKTGGGASSSPTLLVPHDLHPAGSVELLARFAATRPPTYEKRAISLSLDEVIKNQTLLFKFMQFLKERGSVHYLQFVLAVDDLNQMVIQPELTDSGKRNARLEVEKLYKTYFNRDAAEFIEFPENVVKPLEEILNGPVDKVVELRTSTCLFEGYDFAYNILEKQYVVAFQESDVYFSTFWGPRLDDLQKCQQLQRAGSLRGAGKLKKKLESLKGVMRAPSPVEGSRVEDDDGGGEEVGFPEDLGLVDLTLTEDVGRRPDLSSLRVTIPYVDQRSDLAGKSFYVFVLDVRASNAGNIAGGGADGEPENWTVERKFNEFYALETKLTEFHGILSVRLPPKFTFGPKTFEYMESRRQTLEDYLAALLAIPELAGSELIDAFLKSEFEFTTSLFPDINFGRMIRSVPKKLLHKERGQNLEPFLSGFVASTEAPKPRPSKLEFRDVAVEDAELRRYRLENPLYENNAGSDPAGGPYCRTPAVPDCGAGEEETDARKVMSLHGFYDHVLFVARKFFSAPTWLVGLALLLRNLLRRTGDAWFFRGVRRKLVGELLTTENVVSVIHLVRDLVFFEKPESRTDQQKVDRARVAWEELRNCFPSSLEWVFGADGITQGSRLIFTCFQQPKLNKQLSYVLLDLCLLELFPEVAVEDPDK